LGAIAVVVHIAITMWRLRHAYFMLDDFGQLEAARAAPLGPAYLFRDLFGHVEPLSLLLNWVFARLAGWNYPAAQAVLISETALAVALVAAIAARARAPLPVAAFCALVAAISWTSIEPDRWWSNGILVASGAMLSTAALWICAKPSALTWKERALFAVCLAVACLTYNKGLLLPALLGLVRVFVRRTLPAESRGRLMQDFGHALADSILAIVAFYLSAAVVIAVKFANHSFVAAPPVSPGQLIEGMALSAQFGWLGGAVGVRIVDLAPLAVAGPAAIAIDLMAGVLLTLSVVRNSAALWLWLGMVLYVLISALMIGSQRIGTFGQWFVVLPRYHTDEVFLSLSLLAMAWGAAYRPAPPTGAGWTPSNVLQIAVGALVALGQLSGGLHYPGFVDADPVTNRRFIEALERDARRLQPGQSVGERQLPIRILPAWFHPWTDLSRLSVALETPPTRDWASATHYLADDGRLHAFTDQPRATVRDMDGRILTLSMVPPFENAGGWRLSPEGELKGWFSALLAPRDKARLAVVVRGQVAAWGTRQDRPDLVRRLERQEMAASGFVARLPPGIDRRDLQVIGVIDGRIGIALPVESAP
jgi:hypothetical protein